MERISRFRAGLLLLFFALILAFFIYTMYDLQVIETGGVIDNTTTFVTLTRVKAARGDILDCNGNKLVGNRASYDMLLNHYVLLSADGTNKHIYNLIQTCEEHGIPYTDNFPVSAQKPFEELSHMPASKQSSSSALRNSSKLLSLDKRLRLSPKTIIESLK